MTVGLACLLLGALTNAAAAYFAGQSHGFEATIVFIILLVAYVVLSVLVILGVTNV